MATFPIHSDFGAQENEVTVSFFSPSICHEVMGPDAMIFVFWMLSFKPAFSLSSFTFIERCSVPLCFLPLGRHHLHIWGGYFSQQSWFQLVIHPARHFSWCTLHHADSAKSRRQLSDLHFTSLHSAYKLSKRGDSTHPWHAPFPIVNQLVVSRLALLLPDLQTGFSGKLKKN